MKLAELKASILSGEAGNIFRGMATLLMGNGAAKLIGLASIPVLTRIYAPEDFGVLSIYTALVAILAPLLTLRYVQAVPLPKTDELAANILALSGILFLIMTIALSLALFFLGEYFLAAISMDALIDWRWLIVFGAIGVGLYEGLTEWATRKKNYRIIAQTQFNQSVLGTVIKIFLGFFGLKPVGLLVGQFVAQGGGVGTYLKFFWRDIKLHARNVSWGRMNLMFRYYIGYPLFRLPSQALLIFSTQAPLFFTAAFYGTEITGQLGLALMALALPVSLLGESMSKAFYAEMASIGRRQPHKVKRLTYIVIQRLVWLSVVPAFVLIFWGRWIFASIFGAHWADAGQFASVLAIYLVFQFVQKPVSYLMFVFDGQKQLLYLNAQRAIATILCFVIGWWLELSVVTTVLIYSIVLSFHYLFGTFLAVKKIPS